MILYLHGFASSSNSAKALEIQKLVNIKVVALDLDVEPSRALGQIKEQIHLYKDEKILLMGSSLGGYYALVLAKQYNLPAVLINPSIYPYKTLSHFVGVKQKNFTSSGHILYQQSFIDQLQSFSFEGLDQNKILLMLQTGDESLNYKLALQALPSAEHLVVEGGSHSFEDFVQTFPLIVKFYKKQCRA